MATTDLTLLTLQKLSNQPNPNPWMNPNQREDDDSWEVRAFAEDTGSIMGTTWPPRSYTCTFCRREFRSAQALGGHMNVHRRDRARLHQTSNVNPSSSSSSFVFHRFPNSDGVLIESPSTLLSISPYPHNLATNCCYLSGRDDNNDNVNVKKKESGGVEEIDLELRLGHRPSTS